jgi:hypothetical protein
MLRSPFQKQIFSLLVLILSVSIFTSTQLREFHVNSDFRNSFATLGSIVIPLSQQSQASNLTKSDLGNFIASSGSMFGPLSHHKSDVRNISANSGSPVGPLSQQSAKSNTTMFVIPPSLSNILLPRILRRFESSDVHQSCKYDVLDDKRIRAMKQWDQVRYVTWQCHGGCGGINDRMKGIWSVLLHSIAIGYEFKIDWKHGNGVLFPEILVPSQRINWASISYSKGTNIGLTFKDTIHRPFDLCKWKSYQSVYVQTNGNVIPLGEKDCEFGFPRLSDIIANQTDKEDCPDPQRGNFCPLNIGCFFWYLFSLGSALLERVVQEFSMLNTWKVEHGLQEAFGVGLHIRMGDRHMSAGDGRDASNPVKFLTVLETCSARYLKNFTSKHFLVVVSDSMPARGIVENWRLSKVFLPSTKSAHVDKHGGSDVFQRTIDGFVDLLLLAFQDRLILSGTSGYGQLAQGIGRYSGHGDVMCCNSHELPDGC